MPTLIRVQPSPAIAANHRPKCVQKDEGGDSLDLKPFHERLARIAVIRDRQPGIHVAKVLFQLRPCAIHRDKDDGRVETVRRQLLQSLDHRSTMLAQLAPKVKPNYQGTPQCNAWCDVERGFREANGDMS
jgi:hypothetical protein